MVQLLAHITQNDLPGFWLTAVVSFAAGAAVGIPVAYRLLMRKSK